MVIPVHEMHGNDTVCWQVPRGSADVKVMVSRP